MATQTVTVMIPDRGCLLECPECYHTALEASLLLPGGLQLTCASCRYTIQDADLEDQLDLAYLNRAGG